MNDGMHKEYIDALVDRTIDEVMEAKRRKCLRAAMDERSKRGERTASATDRSLRSGLENMTLYIDTASNGLEKRATISKDFRNSSNENAMNPSTKIDTEKPVLLYNKVKVPQRVTGGAKKAGKGWFDMQGFEPTPELETDIKLIRMRGYLDPKRFYSKAEVETIGKGCIQVGTVIEGPTEYISSRLTKKERKATIFDEIMADKQLIHYAKNKVNQIHDSRKSLYRKKRKFSTTKGKRK